LIEEDIRRKADRRIIREVQGLLEETSKRLNDQKRKAIETLIDLLKMED